MVGDFESQLKEMIPIALCRGESATLLAKLAKSSYRTALVASWIRSSGIDCVADDVADLFAADPVLKKVVSDAMPPVFDSSSRINISYTLNPNIVDALAVRQAGMEITEVSPSARSFVEERVSSALSILARLSSTWFDFVSAATARIVPLSSLQTEGGSASWPTTWDYSSNQRRTPQKPSGQFDFGVKDMKRFITRSIWSRPHARSIRGPTLVPIICLWYRLGQVTICRAHPDIHALFVWHTLYCALAPSSSI